jgi:hypothetical protein
MILLMIVDMAYREVIRTTSRHAGRYDMTATISRGAGPHTLAFKYLERSGSVAACYSVQLPG